MSQEGKRPLLPQTGAEAAGELTDRDLEQIAAGGGKRPRSGEGTGTYGSNPGRSGLTQLGAWITPGAKWTYVGQGRVT